MKTAAGQSTAIFNNRIVLNILLNIKKMDENSGWDFLMSLFQGADAEILEEGNPEKVINLLKGKTRKLNLKIDKDYKL